MQSIAPFFPWLALATALCAFLAACLGRENQARWFMAAALPWLGGLVLHVFLLRGYLPMHGAFEGSLNVSLFFSACALCFPVRNGRKGIASSQAFLAAAQFLILLPVAVFGAVPMPAENTASPCLDTALFPLPPHVHGISALFRPFPRKQRSGRHPIRCDHGANPGAQCTAAGNLRLSCQRSGRVLLVPAWLGGHPGVGAGTSSAPPCSTC